MTDAHSAKRLKINGDWEAAIAKALKADPKALPPRAVKPTPQRAKKKRPS